MIPIKATKKEKIFEKSIEIGLGSTSHGIPNIIKSDRKCLKIMWLILFLLSSSVGIYLVIQSFINYFNYDVVTSVKVFKEIPTEFPTITFFILRNNRRNIPMSNLIVECKFNNFNCNFSNEIHVNKDKFGFVSYTFKSQLIYFGGSFNSLRIGVNLANISTSHLVDGLRVIIHNKTFDPNYYNGISENGFNVAPGFFYEISVKRIFSYKLGPPYNNCLKDVKSIDSFDSHLYSDCPEECDSIQYDISHSLTKLSTQKFQIDNYIFFSVYYESLQYTVIDQIEKMNIFDLISNIGGNLGLFIGISFLSFAELIELFVEIICIILGKKGN